MTQSDRARLHVVDIDAFDLTVALRAASGAVPDENVDWHAFHRRLSARAELSLARLRHPLTAAPATTGVVRTMPIRRAHKRVQSAWWEHTARWSRLTVGSALAASVGLVAVIRLTPKNVVDQVDGSNTAQSTDVDGTRAAFESAVIGRTRVATDLVLMPSAAELLIPSTSVGATP